ncbi:Homeodomain-like protein [Mycena rosella]|uniref:Homeodomain-like protein n=1 Tax=Mycena rosella TaxID=1033263 RepID=A0AAD7AWL7_MYCRO|nr:Homeodomain-like protein [Mycena rosella]
MVRGKPLSDDLRGAILNMARNFDLHEICHHTGCKKRTVQRVLEDYRKKGTVMREHLRLEMRGAKRIMSPGDIRFLTGLVRHSPDVYLDELREMLEETRGSEVSEATIWRSLKRCGFTMKKVCLGGVIS